MFVTVVYKWDPTEAAYLAVANLLDTRSDLDQTTRIGPLAIRNGPRKPEPFDITCIKAAHTISSTPAGIWISRSSLHYKTWHMTETKLVTSSHSSTQESPPPTPMGRTLKNPAEEQASAPGTSKTTQNHKTYTKIQSAIPAPHRSTTADPPHAPCDLSFQSLSGARFLMLPGNEDRYRPCMARKWLSRNIKSCVSGNRSTSALFHSISVVYIVKTLF